MLRVAPSSCQPRPKMSTLALSFGTQPPAEERERERRLKCPKLPIQPGWLVALPRQAGLQISFQPGALEKRRRTGREWGASSTTSGLPLAGHQPTSVVLSTSARLARLQSPRLPFWSRIPGGHAIGLPEEHPDTPALRSAGVGRGGATLAGRTFCKETTECPKRETDSQGL